MSTENLMEFNKRLQTDETLRAEMEAIKNDDGYIPAAEIIRLAKQYDCPFTLEEFRQSLHEQALSDRQLDDIGGGFYEGWPCKWIDEGLTAIDAGYFKGVDGLH